MIQLSETRMKIGAYLPIAIGTHKKNINNLHMKKIFLITVLLVTYIQGQSQTTFLILEK